MLQTWGELAEAFDSDKDVEIAHVDCTAVADVCQKLEVSRQLVFECAAVDDLVPSMLQLGAVINVEIGGPG